MQLSAKPRCLLSATLAGKGLNNDKDRMLRITILFILFLYLFFAFLVLFLKTDRPAEPVENGAYASNNGYTSPRGQPRQSKLPSSNLLVFLSTCIHFTSFIYSFIYILY
jgi:hypothetical protein